MAKNAPPEVRELYKNLRAALDTKDEAGRKVGDAKFGVYCFYDYDEEPIYVGQTRERLRTRVRRHLTNQRTDAVSMFVLDPYEVHSMCLWPFWELQGRAADDNEVKRILNRAEYTVYAQAIEVSDHGAILNEKVPAACEFLDPLPPHTTSVLSPAGLLQRNRHPDVRLTRRAQTLWMLSKVVSEREVSNGLRNTLLVQAKRLVTLAEKRLEELE